MTAAALGATIELAGRRTVLRLTVKQDPSPKSRGAYKSAWIRARVARVLCRDCGRNRSRFKWRCDRCQARQRRWAVRRYPSGNFGWFDARRESYRQRERLARHVARFESRLAATQTAR